MYVPPNGVEPKQIPVTHTTVHVAHAASLSVDVKDQSPLTVTTVSRTPPGTNTATVNVTRTGAVKTVEHGLDLVIQPVSHVQAHTPTIVSNALQPPTRKLMTLSVTVKNTTSETTVVNTRDHATTLVEHVTDQTTVIVTSVSITPHGTLLTSVPVMPTGQEMLVKISQATVTQSAIKNPDVMDTESATVTSVSPTPIVKTMENAYVTSTGAVRTAPSTQVSVTQSAPNVTAQRPVTVPSVLAMPTVMLKEPAVVSPTGQAQTVASTIKPCVSQPVTPTKTQYVLDLFHATVLNALSTHPATNITKTVSVTTTGVMMTVNSTLVTAQYSVPDVTVMEKMSVTDVTLAGTRTETLDMAVDNSSENPNSMPITYVSVSNGGPVMTVQLMLENVTTSATVAGDQMPTNVNAVSNTPIKTPTDSVNVSTHNGPEMTAPHSLVTVTQPASNTM